MPNDPDARDVDASTRVVASCLCEPVLDKSAMQPEHRDGHAGEQLVREQPVNGARSEACVRFASSGSVGLFLLRRGRC